jgi:CrcB protein
VALLALGGAVGTLARYGLQGLVQPAGSTFPWGTLVVNVTGSFALGFLLRYLLGSAAVGPEMRIALTIGFCGGFTTMSTFAYETVSLLGDQQYLRAAWYAATSVAGSIAATFAGLAAGGKLL